MTTSVASASGSASPSGGRPSTGSKSIQRESDAGQAGADGQKDSKPWTEGDFAYEYVQIAQVSRVSKGVGVRAATGGLEMPELDQIPGGLL